MEGTTFVEPRVSGDAARFVSPYAENLEILHDAITARYDSLETLCEAYLAAGCRIFDLETGIMSRVEGDQYRVIAVRTPIEGLEPGAIFALEDTYCREVFKAERTLAFPHVGRSKALSGHPVYCDLGLEAYISAPIYVGGTIYGTVNFTSTEPREHGFTTAERNIIDLMAKAAGNFVEALEAQRLVEAKSRELEEANRKLREFVGIVAHDLRNPIGAIEGYGRALVRAGELNAKATLFAERLIAVAARSRRLVGDLLDISALQLGAVSVAPEPFALADVARDVLLTVEGPAGEKSVRLETTVPPALRVHADPSRIHQVLDNLVSNAIKFTPAGGTVTIAASEADGRVRVEVADTGRGMEPELVERLLQGGADVTRSGTEGEPGSGFGIRLVREVLRAHDTRLGIDSGLGRGSRFSFELPAADA